MCDKKARMIQKRESGLPTIPVSTDPRYGDWLKTDIAEGELYQDTDTGKWYSRNGSVITNLDGTGVILGKFDAIIEQIGTAPPTVVYLIEDTLGGAFSRTVGGQYLYTATGLLTVGKTSTRIDQGFGSGLVVQMTHNDVDDCSIASYSDFDAGTTDDNRINNCRIIIEVLA